MNKINNKHGKSAVEEMPAKNISKDFFGCLKNHVPHEGIYV